MSARALLLAFLSLFGGFAVPARAELARLTVIPCDRWTVFLEREGRPWEDDRYAVAVVQLVDPDEAHPEGDLREIGQASGEIVSFEGRPLVRARFGVEIPAGAALRVVVRNGDGEAPAVGEFSTRPGATIGHSPLNPSPTAFEIRSETPLAPGGPLKIEESLCEVPDARTHITVNRPEGEAGPLAGLRDVYGSDFTAQGIATPPPLPWGKEDARLFVRFLFESAPGSADALAVDLKAQPAVRLRGAWLFRPELAAFVSRNLPGATNSIRLASLFSRTAVRHRGVLVENTVSLGPSIEADRNFDRVNAVLDLRWQPGFRNLYHPLSKQDGSVHGWVLEGRVGLEAGRSLSRQTAGTLEIDRYDVLRLRPVIHGNWEYKKLSFDASSSLRYLFTEELTADRTRRLRKVKDFRPFTEATLGYFLDPNRNLSLALTYKNGSEPPLFLEIERFSLGLVAKY